MGMLGTNSTSNATAPTPIASSLTYASISTGTYSTCAISSGNNSLVCWGAVLDEVYQAANATLDIPTIIPFDLGWKMISMGDDHQCGVRSDSTTWCSGDAGQGQLGRFYFIIY